MSLVPDNGIEFFHSILIPLFSLLFLHIVELFTFSPVKQYTEEQAVVLNQNDNFKKMQDFTVINYVISATRFHNGHTNLIFGMSG